MFEKNIVLCVIISISFRDLTKYESYAYEDMDGTTERRANLIVLPPINLNYDQIYDEITTKQHLRIKSEAGIFDKTRTGDQGIRIDDYYESDYYGQNVIEDTLKKSVPYVHKSIKDIAKSINTSLQNGNNRLRVRNNYRLRYRKPRFAPPLKNARARFLRRPRLRRRRRVGQNLDDIRKQLSAYDAPPET